MFFLLSKILTFLLVPFNWCVLLVLAGIIFKRKKLRTYFFAAACAIFLLFSNTFIFQAVVSFWEYPVENTDAAISPNQPIVVLGGLSSYDDITNRIYFYEATDRLMQGLLLHKKNTSQKIIISGGSAEIYFDEKPEAEYLKDYLLAIGIESDKVLFETKSRNTHENASYTAALFDSLNMHKNITLITSAFHVKRASGCFTQQGFRVYPIATNASTKHQPLKPADYFMPSLETLQSWPILLKEWMGIMVYKLRGYM
ncbi:YdcF family protein [Carboxylicivirga mesophila]|uniref:YdcF family protein n=1 Tax=Carboxylicivirga mesophila TaxID=1166478 RepID=A0ABS5K870_9BACT|nr:YdcF family protein [Carboxylicivirga mesophila]MBS2211198.1 YdcF family protein [Carboxylicivirga mesophila]